ncbi:DUF2948 family protein [Aureimonas populi]|uniref:DUF2948 family protein n=1 Tax=Aureimonas populi TaxID=1701758 RepID=A0ABW5CJG8_9HYPH|nr:DUF2948 family protein [Aureimonas populi]
MTELKLLALDEDDLAILSAHCQDAVVRAADLSFERAAGRFLVPMNRFVWEEAAARRGFLARRRPYERRRAVLHFDRVRRVSQTGVLVGDPDQVLALLALRFTPGEAPSGLVELVFAGGSAIRLEVECIEAQLADLGAAWSTQNRPDHAREDFELPG